MSFKATEEQVKAVELTNEYRTLKLSALAGAAKTSTCTLVAEANPVQSLDKQVELIRASEFGYIMSDMDKFIEGPIPDYNDDMPSDNNHWSRAGAEQWHTPYEE